MNRLTYFIVAVLLQTGILFYLQYKGIQSWISFLIVVAIAVPNYFGGKYEGKQENYDDLFEGITDNDIIDDLNNL